MSVITPSATAINTERIHRLADFLEDISDQRVSMITWLHVPTGPNRRRTVTDDPVADALNCGTVACTAAWACILFNPDFQWHEGLIADNRKGSEIFREAQRLLGLDNEQADDLFTPGWINDITDDEPHAEQVSTRNIAAALRHLADTGIVRWPGIDD